MSRKLQPVSHSIYLAASQLMLKRQLGNGGFMKGLTYTLATLPSRLVV